MPYAYDPEIASAVAPMMAMAAHAPKVAVHDVETRRKNFVFLEAILNAMPVSPGVEKKVYSTKTADGHDLEMTWFFPTEAPASAGPALLHTHVSSSRYINTVFSFCTVYLTYHDTQLAESHPLISREETVKS